MRLRSSRHLLVSVGLKAHAADPDVDQQRVERREFLSVPSDAESSRGTSGVVDGGVSSRLLTEVSWVVVVTEAVYAREIRHTRLVESVVSWIRTPSRDDINEQDCVRDAHSVSCYSSLRLT